VALRFQCPATGSTKYYTAASGSASLAIPVTFIVWAMVSSDRNTYSDFCGSYNTASGGNVCCFIGTGSDGTTCQPWDGDGSAGVATGRAMTVGSWYRFAWVATSTTAGTFYHGDTTLTSAMTAQTANFTGQTALQSTTDVVWLGGWSQTTGPNGRLANLKVYSVALSAAEIDAESKRYRPVRIANLEHWIPCDERGSARKLPADDSTVYAADRAGTLPWGLNVTDASASQYVAPTYEDGPPIPW